MKRTIVKRSGIWKRRIIVPFGMTIAVCLIVYCVLTIRDVNQRYPDTVVTEVPYGEKIAYKDIEFMIKDVQYMDYEGLKALCSNVTDKSYEKYEPYYEQTFALIEAEVKNIGSHDENVELYQFVLGNDTYSNGIDTELFGSFNTGEELLCPDIKPGESVNVVLTYNFLNQYFKNGKIENMGLIVSLYPQKIIMDCSK